MYDGRYARAFSSAWWVPRAISASVTTANKINREENIQLLHSNEHKFLEIIKLCLNSSFRFVQMEEVSVWEISHKQQFRNRFCFNIELHRPYTDSLRIPDSVSTVKKKKKEKKKSRTMNHDERRATKRRMFVLHRLCRSAPNTRFH